MSRPPHPPRLYNSNYTWRRHLLHKIRVPHLFDCSPFSEQGNSYEQTERRRKICCFHGRDYEECRPLRYKNSVRTSQETHYVPTTETSRLMLCKIRGFHHGDYEDCRLLGCYAVWLL
jgi:hypothetical protein